MTAPRPEGPGFLIPVTLPLPVSVWLAEKWSATDLHAALDPLTTQDTKTNPNTSFTAPQNVAAGGDPMAGWKLGRMYADGDGVARDDVRAFEYFSRIANAHANDSPSAPQAQIVASAFVALGRYYLNGIPNSKIKPDTERAREMFSYAASYFGSADAQYDLAGLYLKTPDASREDFRYGARWLGLATHKGQHQAQALLGQMLFSGDRKVQTVCARICRQLTVSSWTKPRRRSSIRGADEQLSRHARGEPHQASRSSSALASRRTGVSKPSVNEPYTSARRS
jgi:uncharacterized protein